MQPNKTNNCTKSYISHCYIFYIPLKIMKNEYKSKTVGFISLLLPPNYLLLID